MLYETFLDEELFPIVKPISEISAEDIESIWSTKLIAFLIDVTTFLAFFKKSIEQSNG